MTVKLLDAAGRRRSPATIAGHRRGCPPRNKGMRYPADPPRTEEIIAVMRQAGYGIHGARMRALIVVLWRAGLRINEALMLSESDLEPRRGSILVRFGKGGKRREVGMDDWGWEQLAPWVQYRVHLPVGNLFCVIDGPSRGRAWSATGARSELRRLGARAGVGRRFAPHHYADLRVMPTRRGERCKSSI
jgi:site-specific recombinase XerD